MSAPSGHRRINCTQKGNDLIVHVTGLTRREKGSILSALRRKMRQSVKVDLLAFSNDRLVCPLNISSSRRRDTIANGVQHEVKKIIHQVLNSTDSSKPAKAGKPAQTVRRPSHRHQLQPA